MARNQPTPVTASGQALLHLVVIAFHQLKDVALGILEENDPQAGHGLIQAYRRPKSVDDSLTVNLRGLDAGATYELTNIDTGKADKLTGAQLIQDGYKIPSPEQPGGPLIEYKKVP